MANESKYIIVKCLRCGQSYSIIKATAPVWFYCSNCKGSA